MSEAVYALLKPHELRPAVTRPSSTRRPFRAQPADHDNPRSSACRPQRVALAAVDVAQWKLATSMLGSQ